MCGRYSLSQLPEDLQVVSPEEMNDEWIPRYNIAPSQLCAIIPQRDPKSIHFYKWGLIPSWAKDMKMGFKMINARAETLWEKPAFKQAVKKRRCIVPADGFYEWKRINSKIKQPYRICLRKEDTMYFAGIHEAWEGTEGRIIHSFSIITTEPNDLMAELHNRMPVIFPDDISISTWLNPNTSEEELKLLLSPCDSELLKSYPVSPSLGNVKNDGPHLIKPFYPPQTLF